MDSQQIRSRRHYERNRTKVLRRHRKWYKRNKMLMWMYRRLYNLSHVIEKREYSRTYRLSNLEACKKREKRWRKQNPGAVAEWDMTRIARLKYGAIATNRIAIRKIYARAAQLRQWFDVVVDHKIPLSKGGEHEPSNLQIIYAFENLRKHARSDYVPSVSFQ
jgi:5-methylcytosine-specific restriction endonuclease McrA